MPDNQERDVMWAIFETGMNALQALNGLQHFRMTEDTAIVISFANDENPMQPIQGQT